MRACVWTALALAAVVGASRLEAQGAADDRRFAQRARLLMLPEEQTLLRELKDDKDRRAFQEIFWARRDPTPGTAANEFRDAVQAVWKRADEVYAYPNERGAETGCGQVLALLGRPEEVVGPSGAAPAATRSFDNLSYLRDGAVRQPETWVYRDRPGLPYHFTGAELRVAFDTECRFAEAGVVLEDLRRAARALVTQPGVAYVRGSDGHLAALASGPAAGPAGGAKSLLATTRSDFPLAAEPKLMLRTTHAETYVAGLVQATDDSGAATARFSVAAEARDANGQTAGTSSLELPASAADSGRHLASWGFALRPGRYTLAVAALLGERGSVTKLEIDVPDLSGRSLSVSPLLAFPDQQGAAPAGPASDPYSALHLGPMRRPRFGNLFAPSDALIVTATLVGAKLDASGRADLRARFSILKDGKPVARGGEDVFPTAEAVTSVGPIPLAAYAPGAYVVRLDVTDTVAGQTLRQELTLEIRKP